MQSRREGSQRRLPVKITTQLIMRFAHLFMYFQVPSPVLTYSLTRCLTHFLPPSLTELVERHAVKRQVHRLEVRTGGRYASPVLPPPPGLRRQHRLVAEGHGRHGHAASPEVVGDSEQQQQECECHGARQQCV